MDAMPGECGTRGRSANHFFECKRFANPLASPPSPEIGTSAPRADEGDRADDSASRTFRVGASPLRVLARIGTPGFESAIRGWPRDSVSPDYSQAARA